LVENLFFFFLRQRVAKGYPNSLKQKKAYKKEKWDITQTLSKGCEPVVGHSQHIFNQILPNNVWCILPPQKAIRPQT